MSTLWTRNMIVDRMPGKSGILRPLTGSVYRVVLSDVGEKIMTWALGGFDRDLNSQEIVTSHHHYLYCNLSLLTKFINHLGFSEEDLTFFTDANFNTKIPWFAILRNCPGVLRVLQKELSLEDTFRRENRRKFTPVLKQLEEVSLSELSTQQIWQQIETILELLKEVTRYQVSVVLSLQLRKIIDRGENQTFFKYPTLENFALQALASLAYESRNLLSMKQLVSDSYPSLFAHLAESPDGESVLDQFNQWLSQYGYLSDNIGEISVHRWQENPRSVRELFSQFIFNQSCPLIGNENVETPQIQGLQAKCIQNRLILKGQIDRVYAQLLAYLRWGFLALAQEWIESKMLNHEEEIFFLELSEISSLVQNDDSLFKSQLALLIVQRRSHFEQDLILETIPDFIYT